MAREGDVWTNESVLAFAGESDPVATVISRARAVVMSAIEDGWSGPPYDPFTLAEILKVEVVARHDIPEARTVPGHNGLLIEFNSSRPLNRTKYSISHELAHTLFPDCANRVRNRVTHRDSKGDDWQLETLCNIAAAELLLPIGSIPALQQERLTIDSIVETRKLHQVSAEAVLLRAIRLTEDQCAAFSASRRQLHATESERYYIDYTISSRTWDKRLGTGTALPLASVVQQCTAIGYTAKRHELWHGLGEGKVECLGIAAHPNDPYPRVIGIVRPQRSSAAGVAQITALIGDATVPRGTGARIIAQLVNDSAFTWGAGFSLAMRQKWPTAQKSFRTWAETNRQNLKLGRVHIAEVGQGLSVASMIAQRGFGPSPKPRIRYGALESCLEELATLANGMGATVHMPRIGSGQAGGSWNIIRELIEDHLCRRGINVFIYELPSGTSKQHPQSQLAFS